MPDDIGAFKWPFAFAAVEEPLLRYIQTFSDAGDFAQGGIDAAAFDRAEMTDRYTAGLRKIDQRHPASSAQLPNFRAEGRKAFIRRNAGPLFVFGVRTNPPVESPVESPCVILRQGKFTTEFPSEKKSLENSCIQKIEIMIPMRSPAQTNAQGIENGCMDIARGHRITDPIQVKTRV